MIYSFDGSSRGKMLCIQMATEQCQFIHKDIYVAFSPIISLLLIKFFVLEKWSKYKLYTAK